MEGLPALRWAGRIMVNGERRGSRLLTLTRPDGGPCVLCRGAIRRNLAGGRGRAPFLSGLARME